MGVLSPLIIGICIAFILNIALEFIEERMLKPLPAKAKWIHGHKRGISVVLTYTFAISMVIMISFFIVPQVVKSLKTLIDTLPGYSEAVQGYATNLYKQLGLSKEIWDQVISNFNNITSSVTKFTGNMVNALIGITIGLTSGVIDFFVGLVLSIYILLSKEKLINSLKKLNRAYLSERAARRVTYVMGEINQTFSKFIGGQLLESLALGLLCFIGMLILRIPYAPLVSTLVAVTSVIPVLGAYLGIVPAAFIIFMESPIKTLIFLIFITVLQQIESNLIYPKIVGNAIGLDGFWVLLAIVMAGKMFGLIGMIIGVPAMAVIYTIVRRDTNKKLIEKT